MRILAAVRLLVVSCLLYTATVMASIDMTGNVSYQVTNGVATFNIGQITNNNSSYTTGTLSITLWATSGNSPVGSGYTLATVSLGELTSNEYFYNIQQSASYSAPPDGTYYIHIIVQEYGNGIVDSSTFSQETFGDSSGSSSSSSSGSSSSSSSGGGSAGIDMTGNVGYEVSGSSVIFNVDRITNNNSSYTTGTLSLTLWATSDSDPVGSGYELASVSLGELDSNEYFYDITQTGNYTVPPDGTYYLHVIVQEYGNGIVDWVTFSQETFGGSSSSSGSSTSSSSSSSSGGSSSSSSSGGGSYTNNDIAIRGTTLVTYSTDGYIYSVSFPGENDGSGNTVSIINNGQTTTGNLSVRVAAISVAWDEASTFSGYTLADYNLGTLSVGDWYADFVGVVSANSNHPSGWYYVYTFLLEDGVIVDFTGPVYQAVGCDTVDACDEGVSTLDSNSSSSSSSSSGGGSGGGGGSSNFYILLLLLSALIYRIKK